MLMTFQDRDMSLCRIVEDDIQYPAIVYSVTIFTSTSRNGR